MTIKEFATANGVSIGRVYRAARMGRITVVAVEPMRVEGDMPLNWKAWEQSLSAAAKEHLRPGQYGYDVGGDTFRAVVPPVKTLVIRFHKGITKKRIEEHVAAIRELSKPPRLESHVAKSSKRTRKAA